MTDAELERAMRLSDIFMPYAMKQRRAAYEAQGVQLFGTEGIKFAHYTSAEAALSILSNKCIWMRNTTCMADYREVQHGFEILQRYFSQEANVKAFTTPLDAVAPGVAMEAINLFNGWWKNRMPLNIYVTSLSEHDVNTENEHGRLSMWRGFGNDSATRVALIVRFHHRSQGAEALRLMFSPVAYLKEQEVQQVLREVIANVTRDIDYLKSIDKQHIISVLFLMLFAGVSCLKHEGFREEREWRAVYYEAFQSPLMARKLKTIRGVPQHVYEIPFDQSKSSETADLDVSKIVERVIIGPTAYPWVLCQAFVEVLRSAGVPGAEERVWVSNIPLRASG
jgi:hypothetical protein